MKESCGMLPPMMAPIQGHLCPSANCAFGDYDIVMGEEKWTIHQNYGKGFDTRVAWFDGWVNSIDFSTCLNPPPCGGVTGCAGGTASGNCDYDPSLSAACTADYSIYYIFTCQ